MEEKKLVVPTPIDADGDDVTTWALPEGAVARLGQGLVEVLAFSSDGQYLAVGTRVGLYLYEVETISPVALWETERGLIVNISFSPNGEWIATNNWDNTVKVWDTHGGVSATEITQENYVSTLAFSPDSQWLATSHSETATINIWHPETGEMLTKLTGDAEKSGRFMPIAFSPDAHLIASTSREAADSDGESVLVWNVEGETQIACLTGHTSSIYSLCFSPCGRFLASGGRKDGRVCVWDTVDYQQVKIYTGDGVACMIPSYSPEGVLHATAVSYNETLKDNAIITVWNLEDQEKLYTTKEDIGETAIVDFSDGSRLVHEAGDGGIKVWHFGDPHLQKSDYQPLSFCNFITFSSDGKTLVAEYRKIGRLYSHGDVLFWSLANKRPSRAIETEPVGTEQFFYTTSDGKPHIVSLDGGTVRLWEVDNQNVLIAAFTGHRKQWKRAALTPTGNRLACMDQEGTLIAWDIETMDELCRLTHLHEHFPDRDPSTLEFNPNGKLLLSEMDYYPSARLWNVEQGEEIHEFPSGEIGGITGIWDNRGFSPCGSYLVCGYARTEEAICLWDVEQKEILTTFPFRYASTFAYSPCSSYLACGGDDAEGILLWDLKRREIHKRLSLPDGYRATHALNFSSCGQYLAFGAAWEPNLEKVPICLWEVETGKHITTLWGHPTDVQAVAFSSDNKLLASASFDGSILLWDLTLIPIAQ